MKHQSIFADAQHSNAAYASDIAAIRTEAIERYGEREWQAISLTAQLHGHLGIYATLGAKMGVRACEILGCEKMEVVSWAGHRPPMSCMNDGLQVGSAATIGHGTITVAQTHTPYTEALFCGSNKRIMISLCESCYNRIKSDVAKCRQLFGDCSRQYWHEVRRLAIGYWLEFDRHKIFVVSDRLDFPTNK